MTDRPCLLRVALLDTARAADLVATENLDDDLAVYAVALAADEQLVHDRKSKRRSRDAFLRYVARMGGRATPYGTFAGTAPARVGQRRRLVLAPHTQHRVRVRIDAEVLERVVADALDELPPHEWPLRANPTLRRVAGQLRYARAGDDSADVVTVRATPAIDAVLELLGHGALPGPELVARLRERSPASSADAMRGFVSTLVECELLWRAGDLLQPGGEPVELAVALLDRAGVADRAEALRALRTDACGVHPLDAHLPERLDKAWHRAALDVPALGEVRRGSRFHIDLEVRAPDAAIDRNTVRDLEQALHRLEGIFPRFDALRDFRAAFTRRYEDAEVPLLEALDLETGVLRAARRRTSAVADRAGVRGPVAEAPAEVPVGVMRVFDEWLRTGRPVDIAGFPSQGRTSARSVCAVLLDDHEGRFHSVLAAGFRRSPAAMMARFAHGRPELADRIRAWLRADDDGPDAPLRVELVHTPRTRDGNVLVRPELAAGSIALAGAAGGTLGLDRLLVWVEGDEVRLRDRATGRRVVVELNSAHYIRAVGVHPTYTFLGHLAGEGSAGWSWEGLSGLAHLPRVHCGPVIVSPERWRVRGTDLQRVLAHPEPERALRRLLDGIGDRRWVGFGHHDQLVPVDLTSPGSVRACVAHFARHDAEVVEMPQIASPAVSGPTGRHVAEVVFPLDNEPAAPDRRRPARFDPHAGPRWLYAKYYTGCSTADVVITRLGRLARSLVAGGAISEWFFVRYDEDGHHVRARLLPTAPDRRGEVLVALDRFAAELRAAGLVTRVATDDYVPETARYGGPDNLALAERLFTADSDVVAAELDGCPDEQTRLFRAVADVVHWCGLLFDSAQDKQDFLRQCREGLRLSFEPTGNRHGHYYRQHRSELDEHLAAAEHHAELDGGFTALAASLRRELSPEFSEPVLALVLHMHCNRLFAVDGRRMEYLAYELAARKLREHEARRERGTR